ncbi:hypothetical protein HDU97_009521 [Phlyctochytrium planicorne]|nr:hypothetical protein HDU97_009521 [Phlyctochytrium planicorne]
MSLNITLSDLPVPSFAVATGITAAAALGIIFTIIATTKRSRADDPFPELPGNLPLLGNVNLLNASPSAIAGPARDAGNVFWINVFGMKFLGMAGGELAKWVLVKGEGKYITHGLPARWAELFGAKAISQATIDHRKIRNLLGKGVSKSAISTFYPVIMENAKKVIDGLAVVSDQGLKDVQPLETAQIFTFNAICGFLACADPKDEETLRQLRPHFITWAQGLGDFFLPRWLPFGPFAKALEAKKHILKVVEQIAAERRTKMEAGAVFEDSLGYILAARDDDGSELSGDAVGDNFINLAFAGYDTTAATICSTLHVLLYEINLDELQALRDEILGLEEPISEQTLTTLPILDAFVKEVLRVFSPIPGVFKKTAKDQALEDGRVVRANTNILLNFLSNHQNPEFYPNPKEFRLSRFLVDEVDKKHPLEYTPFGGGPRLCLGMHLAKLEIKVFVFQLLRNFDIGRGSKPSVFVNVPMWIAKPYVRIRSKNL